MAQKKIFAELLRRVGQSGCYQYIYEVVFCIVAYLAGSTNFFNAFLFYPGQYYCPSFSSIPCKQYVCSLPPTQRQSFIKKGFVSMTQFYADKICDEVQLQLIQSIVYMSGFIGLFLGSYFLKFFKKKTTLNSLLVATIVVLIGTTLSPSLVLAGVGLSLNFALSAVTNQVRCSLLGEVIGQDKQGRYLMIMYVAYGAGVTLNGAFFYLIPSWKLVLILMQVVPAVIALLISFCILKESPFDLINFSQPQETFEALIAIAKMNGRSESHGITLQQVKNIKRQYDAHQTEQNDDKVSASDLCKYSSLRLWTVLLFLLQFMIAYFFSMPQLALKDFQNNLFINGVVIGSSEVLGALICVFVVGKISCRSIMLILSVACSAISACLFCFVKCQSSSQCSQSVKNIQTVGLFLFRMLATIIYSFLILAKIEIFPTQIRVLGMQVVAMGYQLAMVLIPLIQGWFQHIKVSVIFSILLASAATCVLTWFLPDTFGKPNEDFIKELAYQSQAVSGAEEAEQSSNRQ